MKILLFGGSGQFGEAFQCHVSGADQIVAPGRDLIDLAAAGVDADISAITERERPDLVVNAAAFTAVDAAEAQARLAYAVNATAAGNIAHAAARAGADLVHLSTDYVFDGEGDRPWRPADPPGPLGVYGASKYAGEVRVRAAHPDALILRTSRVFAPRGRNFVTTMLGLAGRDELSIVDDQIGLPTEAGDLARMVLDVLPLIADGTARARVLHGAGGGPPVSWHGFASEIFERLAAAGRRVPVLKAIGTEDYPTPARRPRNAVLDCSALTELIGREIRDWREALHETMDRIAADDAERPD